jgi:hypothetical protein
MEIVDDLENCTPSEVQETATKQKNIPVSEDHPTLVDAGADITALLRH